MSILEIEVMILCSIHHNTLQPDQIIQFTSGTSDDDCITKLSPMRGYAFHVDPLHTTAGISQNGFHLFSCKSSNIFRIIILDSTYTYEYYEYDYSYKVLQSDKLNDIVHCDLDSTWSEFQQSEIVATDLEITNPRRHGYFDQETVILMLHGKYRFIHY